LIAGPGRGGRAYLVIFGGAAMFVAGALYLSQRLREVAPVATLMPVDGGGSLEDDLEIALRQRKVRVVRPGAKRPPKTGVIVECAVEGAMVRVRLLRATNRSLLVEERFEAASAAEAVAERVRDLLARKE
jgi:hypothetical protein